MAHCRRPVRVRDIPVIQFLVMVLATVYVVTNLLADVATSWSLPRLADEHHMSETLPVVAPPPATTPMPTTCEQVVVASHRESSFRVHVANAVGLLIVMILAFIALFGRYVAPYGEDEASACRSSPSGETRKDARVRLGQRRSRRVDAILVRRQARS